MPRFVILRHTMAAGAARGDHWDLMFERDGALQTWASDELPSAMCDVFALQLPDHRLAYLELEGELSENRGHVARWDCGQFEIRHADSAGLVLALHGEKLRGALTLLLTGEQWSLAFVADSPTGQPRGCGA